MALCSDVLAWVPRVDADFVFSVGLVEHFSGDEIASVVRAHFDCARRGGLVVISVPTPTWLYRATRWVAERSGVWRFPDEQAIPADRVLREGERFGDALCAEVLWPLVLTQAAVVFRKR